MSKNLNSKNQNEALDNFAVYSRRNANSNNVLRNINISNEGKLDRDFDNNTLTRRYPFNFFMKILILKY